MPQPANITRTRQQNKQFLNGHRTHPKALKGYKNVKPATFFAANEKYYTEAERKLAKLDAVRAKLVRERQARTNKIATPLAKSRASAKITLKGQSKILKSFLG